MRATLKNKYDKATSSGQLARRYVYMITSATPEELLDFEITQGKYYVTDEETGLPLLNSSIFEGNEVTIVKGKTKNKQGQLVDVFRPMGSEDFELKRGVYTKQLTVNKTQSSILPQAPVKKENIEDTEL
jgi:hypothetical protein